jgi:hypothetical protein
MLAVAEWSCERLIGSVRRECLDHVMVLSERYLRHQLANDVTCYNGAHASCARQGCSAPQAGTNNRAYRINLLARRSPSSASSGGTIGRHRGATGVSAAALKSASSSSLSAMWRSAAATSGLFVSAAHDRVSAAQVRICCGIAMVCSAHVRTRKTAGSMTRKLSVTWSQ